MVLKCSGLVDGVKHVHFPSVARFPVSGSTLLIALRAFMAGRPTRRSKPPSVGSVVARKCGKKV